MSYPSASPLRVGSAGTLDGKHYTVRGRAVLCTEVDQETDYWQEFNLVDGAGGTVTLVFEEEENGWAWKLFKLFDPSCPLSAAEAAAKRVGQGVDLIGRSARVTLVGRSRVVQTEGEMSEGMARGSVADYFNADAAGEQLVVSWTGSEVEFYRGRKISVQSVSAAFGLSRAVLDPGRSSWGGASSGFQGSGSFMESSGVKFVVIVGAVLFFGWMFHGVWRGGESSTTSPPVKLAAPSFRLANGARGTLAGTDYTVTSHALVEVAGIGGKFERHEYGLVGPNGATALLIHAFDGDAHDWHLFRPVTSPDGLTPLAAAAKRASDSFALDGATFKVSGLFLCQTLAQDGDPAATPAQGGVLYGFVARAGADTLLARWSESALALRVGRALPEAEVLAALARKPEFVR